jgi:hypothetical protein
MIASRCGADSDEIFCELLRRFPNGAPFFAGGFLGLSLQEEIEIAAHHEVGSQGHLMGSPSPFSQEFMQHSQRHLALSSGPLVNGRHHCSRTDIRNQAGK